MTSLGDLVRTAGSSLHPLMPFDAAREISGVHVSELGDPGRYLDGGELLLTTGIPLTGRAEDADYVARIADQGVGALGVGLGEGWDAAPPGLLEHCRNAAVPLFIVPDGAPFLDISRAFWGINGRDQQDEALRSAHAHTRLAQAATGADPLRAVVRLMAQAIGGWVAWIPLDPRAPKALFHPPALEGLLPAVQTDVERSLLRPGVAAASFLSHGSAVVAHSVSEGERTLGAVAIGAGRPLARSDRQLALTAVALLRLLTTRAQDTHGDDTARWVAELAFAGDAAASSALARLAGIPLPDVVRVLADPDDAAREEPALRVVRDGVPLRLLASDKKVAIHRGFLGPTVALQDAPAAAAHVLMRWRTRQDQGFVIESAERSAAWADALADAGADVLETVRAYLRHHQHAEHTARELGVHRNTVRPRITGAERLLGVSLSDPDVAAELWLALRQR
ncbi:PucR family transcriptional regulator [Microbacterium murale]|uniref:Purine catabolism regulator n=1 Tax=Microbacterium murale TaxID=1081040 RepID=A0ABU0PBI1_9MICO|nr:PucR family transcriptional regulator [Microbacterium murale]MDQ0644705.1 purine catabolism regulator [Microbacterium murale]